MIKLFDKGAYLLNGTELVPEEQAGTLKSRLGREVTAEEAKKGTIAYGILKEHNKSANMEQLNIKFDALTSTILPMLALSKPPALLVWTIFPCLISSRAVTIPSVLSVGLSMKMTTCLVFRQPRNMAVSSSLPISRSSISICEKCTLVAAR